MKFFEFLRGPHQGLIEGDDVAEEQKKEKSKKVNCAKCNKPLKRIKRYYRNGKYYCNKKCFADAAKKTTQ